MLKKLVSVFVVVTILITITPTTHAANSKSNSGFPALDIHINSISKIFAGLDNVNMTYIGAQQLDGTAKIISEFNSIGPLPYLGTGKPVAGDLIIADTEGNRYSYYIESPTVLNINGERYRVTEKQVEPIKNLSKLLVEYESEFDSYRTYPKWFAWMGPANIIGFTQDQPLIPDADFYDDESGFHDGKLDIDHLPEEM